MAQRKIKYEKPKSMDVGRAAAVLGESCSYGNSADQCKTGDYPAYVSHCGGGNLTDTCYPSGLSATDVCAEGG